MPIYQAYGTPQGVWLPIGETVYDGACVCVDTTAVADDKMFIQLPQASGTYNSTNYDIPFAAVIGNNLRRPLFNSTGLCNYIGYTNPHDSTTEYVSTGGHLAAGAREPMVKGTLIDPSTILRAQLVNAAVGTPPTVVTGLSAASSTGVALTTGAADVATVDGYATIYFRSGLNKGQYRKLDSTASTTVHTWNLPTYADTAVGDTALVININLFGFSKIQLLATYLNCIDINEALTSHYYIVDTVKLNLAEAGNEFVEFRWNIINFSPLADARS